MMQKQIWCCTCYSGNHLQQPPATAARPACIRIGVEERHGAGVGHEATRATVRMLDTMPREVLREVGAGIWMLALPRRLGTSLSVLLHNHPRSGTDGYFQITILLDIEDLNGLKFSNF